MFRKSHLERLSPFRISTNCCRSNINRFYKTRTPSCHELSRYCHDCYSPANITWNFQMFKNTFIQFVRLALIREQATHASSFKLRISHRQQSYCYHSIARSLAAQQTPSHSRDRADKLRRQWQRKCIMHDWCIRIGHPVGDTSHRVSRRWH